jgi:GNAT superfamily N-acetyltransferase
MVKLYGIGNSNSVSPLMVAPGRPNRAPNRLAGMASDTPVPVVGPVAAPDTVAALLHALPDWFGLEDSVAEYVQRAATADCFVAGGDPADGVLVLDRHFPAAPGRHAVEVAVMAVRPDRHRHGVGSALLAAAEEHARSQGASVMYVKTLGPSDPDAGYAATRAFYQARGFVPLEELTGVWPGNPCLVLVKALGASAGPGGRAGPDVS